MQTPRPIDRELLDHFRALAQEIIRRDRPMGEPPKTTRSTRPRKQRKERR
jgi:hypothetical protein